MPICDAAALIRPTASRTSARPSPVRRGRQPGGPARRPVSGRPCYDAVGPVPCDDRRTLRRARSTPVRRLLDRRRMFGRRRLPGWPVRAVGARSPESALRRKTTRPDALRSAVPGHRGRRLRSPLPRRRSLEQSLQLLVRRRRSVEERHERVKAVRIQTEQRPIEKGIPGRLARRIQHELRAVLAQRLRGAGDEVSIVSADSQIDQRSANAFRCPLLCHSCSSWVRE